MDAREKEEFLRLSTFGLQVPIQNQVFIFGMINGAHLSEVRIPDFSIAEFGKLGYCPEFRKKRMRVRDLEGSEHGRQTSHLKVQDARAKARPLR